MSQEKLQNFLLLSHSALAATGVDYLYGSRPDKPAKKVKPCLRCGKDHTHNNSFCSAECCIIWKSEKRVK